MSAYWVGVMDGTLGVVAFFCALLIGGAFYDIGSAYWRGRNADDFSYDVLKGVGPVLAVLLAILLGYHFVLSR